MTTKQGKYNHNKTALKLYAAPLVMLVMAGALASPTASAEGQRRGYRTVQAAFHYNAEAPAQQVYAELRKHADRMCVTKGPRPLTQRNADRACVASAMKDGISRIGRTHIAALHNGAAG